MFSIKQICKITLTFITILSFIACEKELVINLPTTTGKLVVDGQIESGELPFVGLTYSIGFFEKIDLKNLKFEKNAKVTVTDVTTNFTGQLVMIPLVFGTDTAFAYIGLQDSLRGQFGHQYKLKVEANGIVYEATTSIPFQSKIDSVWHQKIPGNDTAYTAHITYKDPDTLGNYIRYQTQVLRAKKDKDLPENYFSFFRSVFNDAFNNGKSLPILVNLGFNPALNINGGDRAIYERQKKLYLGDTINIKFSAITFDVFNYWETYEFSRNSTGNPFASPTQVAGNVSNAIGIWAGYGSTVIRHIVK
jgi:Domain of unknown function (DUF4249)